MVICVTTYLMASLIAVLVMRAVIRGAQRFNLFDRPGVRKVHEQPIPRLGGIGIAAAMLATLLAALVMDNAIGEALRSAQTQVVVILAAGAFMLVVGVIDDVRGLSVRVKFAAQVLAAIVVCMFGVRIELASLGHGAEVGLGWLSWPVTIFWIVGLTNTVNLIDGLDGLAGGISAVACGVIGVIALYAGQPAIAAMMLVMLGSLTGFLFFNFNPAKIFMGDGGAYFVGFILAACSVLCMAKAVTVVSLALPLLVLGVPILDTLFSILRRLLQRRSIFAPDRGHIHHRLLGMGLSHRRVVILIYLVTLLAASMGMLMLVTSGEQAVMVFLSVLLLLTLVFHGVGSVRLEAVVAGLRRNLAIRSRAGACRREFEQAQLLLQNANTFGAWWKGICSAAQGMGFERLRIVCTSSNGSTQELLWQRAEARARPSRLVHMVLPILGLGEGPMMRAEFDVLIDDTLEAAGQEIALFGRLLDEYKVASVPTALPTASVETSDTRQRPIVTANRHGATILPGFQDDLGDEAGAAFR